jgi:hypothetical protein
MKTSPREHKEACLRGGEDKNSVYGVESKLPVNDGFSEG